MQSKHQIRELLDSAGIRPNKRFGQNFLIDLNLMRLLIDTANIQNNDVVLEVGTGTGSLTQASPKKRVSVSQSKSTPSSPISPKDNSPTNQTSKSSQQMFLKINLKSIPS